MAFAVVPAALAAIVAVGGILVAATSKTPEIRLPQDIVYGTAKDSPGPVTFSHATHVAIADNRCTGCHPAPFGMLKPARRVTHDDMNAGRACGICHDGKAATGVQDDCEHCHRAPSPMANEAKTPAPKGGGS
jgi:c(7)-type cytochrome triheme protein